jgi:putative aldouronate transport system permease protein
MTRRSAGDWIFDSINYVFLGLLGLATLFPFWNVIMTSLVGSAEYYSKAVVLWPSHVNISGYLYIFSTNWIATGYGVTVLITVGGTLFDMILVCTAAYAMTKKDLVGYKFFNYYFLLTMYFSGGLIPYYLVVMKYLQLADSILSMIITSSLNVWSYLVLKNFLKEIPAELPESARIDGAGELKILARIMLPLCLPSIATLALFSAVGHWNEWSRALYFINSPEKEPLQMILRKIVLDHNALGRMQGAMDKAYQNLVGGTDETLFEEAVKAATVTVTALPIMLVYPFLQKYFVKGVLVGSVKG